MLHKHLLDFTRKYNKEFAIKGYSKLKKAELQQKIESVLNKQRKEIKEEYKKLKDMKAETKPKPAPKKTPVKKETKPKPAPKKAELSDRVKKNNTEILKRLNKVNERKVKGMGQNQQEETALYMYVKRNAPNSQVLQIENSPVVKDNRKFYVKGPKRFIFSKSTDKKTIDFIENNKTAPKKEEPKKAEPKSNKKVDDLLFKIENNPNYNDNFNTLVKFLQKTKQNNIFPLELTFAFSQKQNEEHFKALDSNPKLFMDFMAELAKFIKDNNDLKFNILKKYDKKPSNMSVKSQGIIGDEFAMKFKLAKTKINYKSKK